LLGFLLAATLAAGAASAASAPVVQAPAGGVEGETFAGVNALGSYVGLAPSLPTQLTPLQEMQYATSWHGIVALALVVVIAAHIYIGTLGMQGAFSAMGSGQVDVNWAKEHHSLWAEREIEKMEEVAAAETGTRRMAPAE
jgi:formate dehydrogenase subunit gamma